MTSIPDIDTDRLEGFRKMAMNVVDDMAEAARDMASRHVHQLDGLKKRVEELEAENHRLTWTVVRGQREAMNDAAAALGEAIGADVPTLEQALPATIEHIATLKHRIAAENAAPPEFFGVTLDDIREVIGEEMEDDEAVASCVEFIDEDGRLADNISVVDTVRSLCNRVRDLSGMLEAAKSINAELEAGRQRKPRSAVVAVDALPTQAGPWVITRKDAHGRRFWGPAQMGEAAWVADVADAYQYADAMTAERRKPRGSRVVTLADARDLIEAEKVVTLAPVEPTGPEAA